MDLPRQRVYTFRMIIDVHAHAFPDQIAQRAMEKLCSASNISSAGDGTVGGLLESMDQAGVDVSVLCAIATKVGQSAGISAWCKSVQSDRLVAFPSVHPDEPDAPAWVKRFAEAGFTGIKAHPMYQDCAADDPRMIPIYAAAAENDMLVTSHCGFDIAYPPDDDRADPRRFANALEQVPNLRLLCTHMGGWRAWKQADKWMVGKKVWLETSFSFDDLDRADMLDMIARHGFDKVCFGSDWPWNRQDQTIEHIKNLGLSAHQSKAILGDNAISMLNINR